MRQQAGCLMLAMLVPVAAFARGIVVDTNGRPLANVIVVHIRQANLSLGVQPHTACVDLRWTQSDAEGRFSGQASTAYLAYKRGYHRVRERAASGERLVMAANSSDQTQRFYQVVDSVQLPWDCPKAQLRALVEPVLRPRYDEAASIAQSPREVERADGLLNGIEWLTLSREQAALNLEARRRKRDETAAALQAKCVNVRITSAQAAQPSASRQASIGSSVAADSSKLPPGVSVARPPSAPRVAAPPECLE